jgi:phage host-nuclease inhibitor protein Gam
MSKKEKIAVRPVHSRQGLEATVAEAATLKIKYAGAKADMELEIAAVQERHRQYLLDLSRQIEIKEAGVFIFCQQHRIELFPEKKSIDFLLATVGFRTEPPSVEKASKKDTWTAIAKRLEALDWGAPYVNIPEPEVDKKALLDDREELSLEQLSEAGLRFERDENFYITPNSEVAARTVLAAG